MTRYLCDLPHYAFEFREILSKVCEASTEQEFDVCEGLIERFLQKYGENHHIFWVFSWTTRNREVERGCRYLMETLDTVRKSSVGYRKS